MAEMFVPISIESIEPLSFPDVQIFLKNGKNYVLYKSHGRDFTRHDAERLSGNGVEFLHVSKADMEIINEYMEANAERLLKGDLLTSRAKGKMIYQTSVNFVDDIFSNPDKAKDLDRTKRLIENLLLYLSENRETLQSLETVIAHNYNTFVHSLHVTALSFLIHSEAYLISRDEMLDVGIGTLMHDFGKIFVPPEVLNKQGKLTDQDVALMKRHPEEGYQFLKRHTTIPEGALAIVRHHHERNNGSGYPKGLKEKDIPRSVQIAIICDVYCLLTIDRVGNKTLPPHLALQIMQNEMKGAFNEKLLKTLESLVCIEDVQQILL